MLKDIYDAFERSDLKIQNDYLHVLWIEVKNKNKKTVCVVAFTDILIKTLQNLLIILKVLSRNYLEKIKKYIW